MAWIYNVSLRTFKHNNQYMFSALYAGAPGYKDNPEYECVKGKGPLPRDKYRVVGRPFTHPHAGRYTLRLEPSPDNTMCNRGGFLIHGDKGSDPGKASNGCIVLHLNFRRRIFESGDRELIVQ